MNQVKQRSCSTIIIITISAISLLPRPWDKAIKDRKHLLLNKCNQPHCLMRVFINNRLGARTQVLCTPSDTIGAFKRVAAAYLGTRPEAMIWKRQGERPFKDYLPLMDYEILNGSSLDLEIDTGDSWNFLSLAGFWIYHTSTARFDRSADMSRLTQA